MAEQASKAVNISLTLRNWCIGCYLAEFEQSGTDRAQYGTQLLDKSPPVWWKRAWKVLLPAPCGKYRQFYLTYPQIWQTPSAKFLQDILPGNIWQTLSSKLASNAGDIREAASPESDGLPARLLLERLSFSLFAELPQLDDPLQRRVYEAETLRGNWSVRELKRQIATQYFQRSSLFTDKEALARLAHIKADPQQSRQVIRDPYIFEFLGLKPQEVMSEGRLEDALLELPSSFGIAPSHSKNGIRYNAIILTIVA